MDFVYLSYNTQIYYILFSFLHISSVFDYLDYWYSQKVTEQWEGNLCFSSLVIPLAMCLYGCKRFTCELKHSVYDWQLQSCLRVGVGVCVDLGDRGTNVVAMCVAMCVWLCVCICMCVCVCVCV